MPYNQNKTNFSLSVDKDLKYDLWYWGKQIKKTALPSELNSIKTLKKLLSYLTHISSNESNGRPQNDADAIDEAINILENSKYKMDSKISFLIEQLSIATSKPTSRRYSSALLAFCMILHKTSPTAYNQLLGENILTLPSVRRLRQLSSALDDDLKMGKTSIHYLKSKGPDRIINY